MVHTRGNILTLSLLICVTYYTCTEISLCVHNVYSWALTPAQEENLTTADIVTGNDVVFIQEKYGRLLMAARLLVQVCPSSLLYIHLS